MDFFGFSSPLRLLREKWSSATDLATELYAMATSRAPSVVPRPVTIQVPPGQTGLRIVQSDSPPPAIHYDNRQVQAQAEQTFREAYPDAVKSIDIPKFALSPSQQAQVPQFSQPQFSQPPPIQLAAGQSFNPYQAPLLDIQGQASFKGPPVQFEKTPYVFNDVKGKYEPIDIHAKFSSPNNGLQGIYYGVVVGGQGDTYNVKLYRPDPKGELDTDTVTVKVPVIDSNETIDPQTVIGPIIKLGMPIPPEADIPSSVLLAAIGDYFYQPPVWFP